MNKNYLKVPAEHFWILSKREKSQLLSELKRRVEGLEGTKSLMIDLFPGSL